MDKHYYVYILASKRNGTLYIGITSDLVRRIYEHKQDLVEGFTRKFASATCTSLPLSSRGLTAGSRD